MRRGATPTTPESLSIEHPGGGLAEASEAYARAALSRVRLVEVWAAVAYVWATNQVPPDRASRQILLVPGMAAFLICALGQAAFHVILRIGPVVYRLAAAAAALASTAVGVYVSAAAQLSLLVLLLATLIAIELAAARRVNPLS